MERATAGWAGWPSSPDGSATGVLAHGDAACYHGRGDRALGGGRQCCRLALHLPSRHTCKLGCRVGGALRRAARTAPPRLGSGANVSTQKASGKERPVQRLQFPCWEPGQALPTETLLPFLAAVGRCCSRDTEQPGTLLSHCRCRWTGPRGAGGARTASRLGARARGHSPPRSLPTPPGNPCPSAWAQAGGGSPGRPSPVPWPRPPVAPPT